MIRLVCVLGLMSTLASAVEKPVSAKVGIDEHLGGTLPLDAEFTDQTGHHVRLGDVLLGKTPTILVMAYYECPMLCGLVLQGLAKASEHLDWKLGERYRLLTVSFDPKDGPHNADLKRNSVLAPLHRTDDAWPFLVGKEESIKALTDALGFRYSYDASTKQFAHPAAAFVITPDGHISRYLYGIDYPLTDLKLALIEADQGKSGSSFERLILTCFHYDPTTRRYGPYIFGFLRAGSILVALTLGVSIFLLRRRERQERPL